MSDINRRLDTLTPKQRHLLIQRMRKKADNAVQTTIVQQERTIDRFPLSFAQERLWFLDQLEPESSAYNIPLALRLSGPFEISVLERALQRLVARHETLRTTFTLDQEQAVQVIAADATRQVPLLDLLSLPAQQREQSVLQLVRQEAQRPFNLRLGPLLRLQVIRLEKLEHVLLLTMHHIISDGWSIGVLVREFSTLYYALALGEQIHLPALPIQYADYAYAQRQDWQRGLLQPHIDYWRRQLVGAPDLIDLPLDRPRPPVQTSAGAKQYMRLSPRLTQALVSLSQHEVATLFMTLLASFQILLMRLSGQHDILIGTPIANRNRNELERLIGFFINTLVLRVDLTGNPSFRELLQRVRQVALDGYAHQELPFERLVEELQITRSVQHAPLVQVLFNMLNFPITRMERSGLTWSPLAVEETPARFDLVIRAIEGNAGLECEAIYNTALFDEDTIERLLHYWRVLLEAIVHDANQRIEEIPLLGAREYEQQLPQWNLPVEQEAPVVYIQQAFEQQVARMPDALALIFEQDCLTYAELNHQANHLASCLKNAGVGPDVFVGICLERSLEMVIALLAVLKAGGAYVPLDPSYPQERIIFMLKETSPVIVLTQVHLQHMLASSALSSMQVLALDADRSWVSSEAIANPPNETLPEHLAYLIYTSGSTGRPKGVMNTHRGISNRLLWMQEAYQLQAFDRVLQKTPMSFDVSVWEFFWPLQVGACLVMARPDGHRDPGYLKTVINEQQITTLHFVPTMLHVFLQEPEIVSCTSLRRVICSGEALLAQVRDHFFSLFATQSRLLNLYGPTEAAIDVTAWECRIEEQGQTVPIGRPISNTQIYLLNSFLQPVPVGVPGELYIGGVSLARGYVQRTDLTAERFIPHPFSTQAGARLYRTGDLARYRADGAIEFLGRADDQVKLHGFRIELGEIEAVLRQQPAVSACIVLLREDVLGEQELVAHLVLHPGKSLDIKEGRQAVATVLPLYMVPARWIFLDALPLTSSGKVDRRALRALPAVQPRNDNVHVLPRTILEAELALIWQAQLHVEQVDIHGSFFELGGDSIKAAIFINKLQSQLGVIVHVVTLFDYPTIGDLADYLASQHQEAVERTFGAGAHLQPVRSAHRTRQQIDATMLKQFCTLIPPLPALSATRPTKNPPAIFVLAPPRSGTTLLRVMLAGHPQLFAPPELELLTFNTLQERRRAYSGRNSFWLEGTLRALMEIKEWDVETARTFMEQCEQQGLTTQDLYACMQDWLAGRRLVDKTPDYALDMAVLQRAEEIFEQPYYIHLLRHPYGMIRSFEEARLDQIFFRYPHAFDTRELAELVWLLSQQNIRTFLRTIPVERQMTIRYETLVKHPERIMRELCEHLHIAFHPEMLQPYQGRRMTDGLYAASRMLGDVKFRQHQGIDAKAAEQWRQAYSEDFLGDITWQEAEMLGYPRETFGQVRRTEERGLSASSLQNIERQERQEPLMFPLSFAQERLWILDQFNLSSATYSIPAALRLRGALSVRLLELSLGSITERHEIMRTTFQQQEGVPVQVIASDIPIAMKIIDLTSYGEDKRDRLSKLIAQQWTQAPFDLAQGPLMRVCLLRLSEQEHILVYTIHHIISDGWSMGVITHELVTIYRALLQGTVAPLPDLPIQYADYALWQRKWLQGEVLQEQLTYWQQQLKDAPAILNLPLDRPRPAVQTYTGAGQSSLIPMYVLQELKALSQQESATTLFMVLLAAFQVLLMRYSGQEDILVGTPIANRTHKDVEALIGFFVNTLVIRTDLRGNLSFRQLLAQVHEVTLGAYRHQDLPFERLIEELQPERSLSYSPLFQVLFSLQNTPQTEIRLDEAISWQHIGLEQTTAKFDLSCNVRESDAGLATFIEYNTDLFDATTITRWLKHWQILLQGIIAHPDQAIATLPLLTPLEQQTLLYEWNATSQPIQEQQTLPQRFETQVATTADSVALVFEEHQLTYGELNRRAHQLALRLRTEGVGPEVFVGICMENSIEFVVSTLAVLKVGGVYVPLDPSYPAERLAYITQDAQISTVLTLDYLQDRFSAAITSICLDAEEGITKDALDEKLDVPALEDSLIYLIYTSGSTGKPKGTGVSHKGFSNMLNWFIKDCSISAQTKTLVLTSFSFDLTQKNLFAPLLVGGTVTLQPLGHYDPHVVRQAIAHHAITFINCPSGMFYPLVEDDQEHDFASLVSLRGVFLGAESLAMSRLLNWLSSTRCQAFNSYGPTECTDIVCFEHMKHPEQFSARVVPIGRPIANTQIYILDAWNNPAPIGVVGELYVGGEGVARGYIGRPDVTAESFVPDPFRQEPGARLYKTGDMVRYLPDGQVEFVGRRDFQVKLRGFRIEPGEIEAVLRSHPDVLDAVIVVREEAEAEKYPVAYLQAQGGVQPIREELRRFMSKRLPEYMVPSLFVLLDTFPLTSNGKVDRRKLAQMPLTGMLQNEERVAPRNVIEQRLAAIWQELLHVEQVGVYDNFFEAGGHSLLAVRLLNRVNQQFGRKLSLTMLFQAPTIAHLAARIQQAEKALVQPISLLVPLQPEGEKPPFFSVHPASGYVSYFATLAQRLPHDRPFYGIQVPGLDGQQETPSSVEEMAAVYIAVVRSRQPRGPYFLGGYSSGGLVAFEMAQQLQAQGEIVALVVLFDTFPPSLSIENVTIENAAVPERKHDYAQRIMQMVETLEQTEGRKLAISYADMQHLQPNEQLAYFLERLKAAEVVPQYTELSQLRIRLEVIDTIIYGSRLYTLKPYTGRVALFLGEDSPGRTHIAVWRQNVTTPLETYFIPGDHHSIMDEPHVATLATYLQQSFDGAINLF